jgi:NAD(P)-dependent dehydrogenase (short-subunit alcohol dehydrogenase family)
VVLPGQQHCQLSALALVSIVAANATTAGARAETQDGLEVHMQTNHLSHFLLTLGLLPALKRGAQQPPQQQGTRNSAPAGPGEPFRPRIVSVASAMHHFGYTFGPEDPLLKQSYSSALAYGNSKLAQVGCCQECMDWSVPGGVSAFTLGVACNVACTPAGIQDPIA